ncbi:MAG: hypothetical protein IT435_02980 [Phycisphaerales bacterium]|nr:hypothetical protein [Phycisphaerales bacterium]
MFLKLAACVLSMGLFGCGLLAMRQARLQAAHELTQTQLRIRTCDERLFKLRTEIGMLVRPDDVRSMVTDLASLKPLLPEQGPADLPVQLPAAGGKSSLDKASKPPQDKAAPGKGKNAPGERKRQAAGEDEAQAPLLAVQDEPEEDQ